MNHLSSSECDTIVPPSSLFVFWPGEEPPTAEEVRLRLSDLGRPARDADPHEAEGTLWSFWFDLAEQPLSYLVWCEPVAGEHLKLLDTVRWRNREQEQAAQECRWLVGVEGAISLRRPTSGYQLQLRLCEAIAGDWCPVVFDASSLTFRTTQDVHYLADTETPPRTACLYSIHKVRDPDSFSNKPTFWLHTHGLERSGVPELELFQIPEALLPAACELIDAVTDLWMEFGTPDPQVPFAIGRDLSLAWRPWQAVLAEKDPLVGGWACRRREPGHAGYRAVLVTPVAGLFRRRWVPPLALLERLTKSETTLYKTASETRRMAQLARERWGTFGTLFASPRPPHWRFAVKLNFPMNHDPEHGEHLWFDCVGLQRGRVRGRLVSEPSFRDDLSVGSVEWYDLEQLSDWRIFTADGVFDPENAETLLE